MVHWSYHWSPLEPTCSRPLRPTAPTQQAGFAGAVILVAGLDAQPQSVAAAAAAPARALRARPDRASRASTASTSAPNASSRLRLIAWSPPSLSGLSRFGAETPLLPRCLQQFPCPQQVCLILISLFLNLYPPDRRHRFYKCFFCLLPLAHRLCPPASTCLSFHCPVLRNLAGRILPTCLLPPPVFYIQPPLSTTTTKTSTQAYPPFLSSQTLVANNQSSRHWPSLSCIASSVSRPLSRHPLRCRHRRPRPSNPIPISPSCLPPPTMTTSLLHHSLRWPLLCAA